MYIINNYNILGTVCNISYNHYICTDIVVFRKDYSKLKIKLFLTRIASPTQNHNVCPETFDLHVDGNGNELSLLYYSYLSGHSRTIRLVVRHVTT